MAADSCTLVRNCFGYSRLHLHRRHGPWFRFSNVTRDASRQRKRGRRGGVKTRLRRRQARPPPICSIRKHSVTKQQNGRTSRNVPITFPRSYRSQCYQTHPSVWTIEKVSQVRQWTQEAIMKLQGFLACSDWGVFAPDFVNLNEHASMTADHITFCMNSTFPMKTVTVYPNSKPWITSENS